jgi:hypothetical protein
MPSFADRFENRHRLSNWLASGPLLASLLVLAGCPTDPTKVDVVFKPPEAITLSTPFGSLVFSFSKEKEKTVASADQLAKQSAPSKDSLLFREFDFNTGPLPEGCKPFEAGRYGNFEFPDDGAAVAGIRKKVEALRAETGAPDEAAIALAVYEARAFRSLCGPATMAKLKPGSRINGWLLNDKAVKVFGGAGQAEIDVTPRITIIALEKKEFEGRLKPTAMNVLLSRYRYEIPPNSDSVAFDPKTGSTVLTYTWDLRDVALGNATRDVLAGGVLRIFIGKRYIYLIDFYTNTAGISDSKWTAFQTYVDNFRYVASTDN